MSINMISGIPQTIINEGDREHLELTEPLYMGGIAVDIKNNAFNKWHIRHTESFGGRSSNFLNLIL